MTSVAIVVNSLGMGGAERSASNLSLLLHDAGYDVHVIAVWNNKFYPHGGTYDAIQQRSGLLRKLQMAREFKRLLVNYKVTQVIDYRTRVNALKERSFQSYIYRGLRTIYTVHSANEALYLPSKARKILMGVNDFVFVSQDTHDRLAPQFPSVPSHVVYNWMKLDELDALSRKRLPPEAPQKYILWFGRLDDDTKDISGICKAYMNSDLPDQDIHLMILGDGPSRMKLMKDHMHPMIDFRDAVDNPYPFVAKAVATIINSRFEGLPTVVVESLHLGTFVIAKDDIPGIGELVMDGVNGILFSEGDGNLTEVLNQINEHATSLEDGVGLPPDLESRLDKNYIAAQWQAILSQHTS